MVNWSGNILSSIFLSRRKHTSTEIGQIIPVGVIDFSPNLSVHESLLNASLRANMCERRTWRV